MDKEEPLLEEGNTQINRGWSKGPSLFAEGNTQTNRGWSKGISFFKSTRSDSSGSLGKVVKSQSWLVPEEATRVPILDRNRDNSISEEDLMRRITSGDITYRSSGSPTVSTKRKRQNLEESKTQEDNRFILDSLRLEFVNDPNIERLFRERFFSIQTGHRHWTAFWQAVGEMFTNMTVSLICIEIVILILVVGFSRTDESTVPYLERVLNCSNDASTSTSISNRECFVVRYFDAVYGYVMAHGIIVSLLFVLIAIVKIRHLRVIMQARGAMLWQFVAPLILTSCAFVCIWGHFVAFRRHDPSYDDQHLLPVPMVTMDFLVQFYSILLVLSCNSGILFWRVCDIRTQR